MSKKQETQYTRSLIEASLDPLFTISPDGKITDVNDASVDVTHVTREKMIGSNFFGYFTEPEKARDIYKKVFTNGFVSGYPLTIRDGKLTDVLFNGSVYKDEDGKVIGVVVVARDISGQNKIESELKEARIHAESATKNAVEAKSHAEKATLIAEDAVRSKQQFLSNMSHEIRTPMNAILGFTKVLLNTDITPKQREYLAAIKMSGDVLTVLINDILDLAKVDSGKMIFEQTPFKMAASITAMIHVFEQKILEKNLKLVKKYDNKIPKVLMGDPVRLHQIILNLVSNAIKFTSEGVIKVKVQLLDETAEEVTIEIAVSDTGIGIAADKIDHIFENFQQATDETTRLYGGTGLGLAIVKQLVEKKGGSISVLSIPDMGSTFSVILPFLKTTDDIEQDEEILELKPELKGIKVLVVEDIVLNQLLMKTLLDDFGFEYDIAGDGKIAIEKLRNNSYDIILMDLRLPKMNGFEATEYIRNTMNSQIPIIALTADVTTVDLKTCRAVGMNDYISKPVDEELLYKKMYHLLNKKQTVQDIRHLNGSQKYVDLTYLRHRTKANRELMMEMISLYQDQTPVLISKMKQSMIDKDWESLYQAVHSMIPSFSIMGIHSDIENMAKKIQEYVNTKQHLDEVNDLLLSLEDVCSQSCEELEEEIQLLINNH